MTQPSLTTRLDPSINTLLPETHGPQRQAVRDCIAALVVVRTCCQAALARYFPNCEAASRRLTRWLHNPRLEPQAQAPAPAQAVVAQRPLGGTVRLASAWTTEDQQHLLVAALVVGRRAVPLYWAAYPTAERKGTPRALEHALVEQRVGTVLNGLARTRLLVTAARGFCTGECLARLDRWSLPFVVRLTAHVTVCLDQQWQQLGSLRLPEKSRRRAWGRRWGRRSKPHR
jgi:hypothetical protein